MGYSSRSQPVSSGGILPPFYAFVKAWGEGFSAGVGRGGLLDRRRLEPAPWFPARLRAGARLSPEKAGGKSAGGKPPGPPSFMARSLLARSFWGLCHIVPVVRLFRCPCTCPDLGAFFWKMLLEHIFLENASQIGLSIPEGIAPRTDQRERSPKRASDSKRAIKPGSRGRAPALFLPISREKWGPPPGRRGPRGAAPRGLVRAWTTRRVRSTAPLPRPGPGGQRGAAPQGGFELPIRRARSTGLPLTGGPGLNQRRVQRERPAETSGGNAQGGLPAGKAALGNEVLFCCLLSTHFKMLAYDLW